jgi:hypothetical protein
MKAKNLKELLQDMNDDELIIGFVVRHEDAQEDIYNLNDGITEEDDMEPPLTVEEWLYIYERVNNDDGVWQEINDSLTYHIGQVIDNRKKGNNDNSK